jgi:hypothetical protein
MKEKVRGREANLFWGCGGKAGEVRGGDARAKGERNGIGQGKCGDEEEMCWSWEMWKRWVLSVRGRKWGREIK